MKRAVVVGRATGFMSEYAAARSLGSFDYVIVVGMVGIIFPDPIDHWVSFHVELFDRWSKDRACAGHPPASCFWGAVFKGNRLGEMTTSCKPLQYAPSDGGSSGLLAVKGVAIEALGVDRVVLAGIPMTAAGHHDPACITDPERARGTWDEADKYWQTWITHFGILKNHVRSMSGRTRDVLGAPTREWLHGS